MRYDWTPLSRSIDRVFDVFDQVRRAGGEDDFPPYDRNGPTGIDCGVRTAQMNVARFKPRAVARAAPEISLRMEARAA
jgi:hypothetical protein